MDSSKKLRCNVVAAGVIVFAAIAAVALAALAVSAVKPAKAANWTGCNVGAAAGIATVTVDPYGLGGDGSQVGVSGGCDYQIDSRLVAGVLASYDWSTIEFGSGVYGSGDIDVTALTIGARAGVLLGRGRDTLAYGLVGWSNADVDTGAVTYEADGLVYGAGVESIVWRGSGGFLALKGQATRTDYEDIGGGLEPSATSVTTGLSWHFGGAQEREADEESARAAPTSEPRRPIK